MFRNRYLLWAIVGPDFHPEFATSWAALASFLRQMAWGAWRPEQEHSQTLRKCLRWPRFQVATVPADLRQLGLEIE